MRINQFIATATGMSRRAADKEVADGRVKLNGKRAVLGDQVPDGDIVLYKGKPVEKKSTEFTTIMLNKPVGYISSRKRDETNAPTVMDLLPKDLQHLKPVGRLDKESDGLLLLTDDGDLLYKSTHPKFEIEKEYLVEFEERMTPAIIAQWKKGMKLPDGIARADSMTHESGTTYRIVLHQGKTRQLRRMAGKTGNAVTKLTRVRSDKHVLGNLKVGAWKKV
ncbi:MAG: Pseudouridine synthase [Parcubacteria group bacterium GW2011_GWA2_47_7]|nr:MAG: Pseudouridine synthase [Parcubacteria group bacterium GW2011_GWA2_47_7]